MKILIAFLTISLFAVCQANLPGLPFLQREMFKNKREPAKRLTEEEEAEKFRFAYSERMDKECFPQREVCLVYFLYYFYTL